METMQSENMRKIFLLSALASLRVVAAISITIVQNHGSEAAQAVVKSTCTATFYPELCASTINAAEPTATKSSKDVLLTTLNYTIYMVERNYFTLKRIGASHESLSSRDKTALHDCLEMTGHTLEELHDCELELQDFGLGNYSLADHKENLMTFLSAVQTNQQTCVDGFYNADQDIRQALMAGHMHVFRLASNVLAIIKNLADTEMAVDSSSKHSSPQRNLGEENSGGQEWPEWLSGGDGRLLQALTVTPDVTVAADGSGNYGTVSEAVAVAPERSSRRYVIRIKAGVYRENVEIPRRKTNLMFVGDGQMATIITGNRNVAGDEGMTTFNSATVAVAGTGFLARDITFQNTAGPLGEQAVALRVNADLSAFYRCRIIAYQDTLYIHSLRQFFTHCFISGTIDFIFGNAAVVIQRCNIRARRPNPGQRNMVTAQGRLDPNQNTGIVIQNCKIGADSDLQPVLSNFTTYLGRPWKEYSKTIIMQNEISNVLHPAGWYEWNGNFALDTLFYAEYQNTGKGANTTNRVPWKGFRMLTSAAQARPFTAGNFIAGGEWLPDTGFPFSLGL